MSHHATGFGDGTEHFDDNGLCLCYLTCCNGVLEGQCTCEFCGCHGRGHAELNAQLRESMVTRVEVSPVPQHQAVTVTMDLDLTELAKALMANEDFQGLMRSLAQRNGKATA